MATLNGAASVAAIMLDVSTTLDLPNHGNTHDYEANPLLGPHPDQASIVVVGVGGAVADVLIGKALPNPWRMVWFASVTLFEGALTTGNLQIGMRFQLP